MKIGWRDLRQRIPGDGLDTARRRLATLAGAVLLALAALLFAKAGDGAQRLFASLVSHFPYAPLLVTPLVFAGIVWVTRRFAPEAKGSGIPQVIAAGRAPGTPWSNRLVSIRVAVAKFVLTVAMLASGASVGREGPTVQISAALMVGVHRLLRVPISAGVLIAGGAAGVAAAFNTPLAGVAFAIEELAAAYEQKVAVLVMGAVMIAGLTSLGIAGDYIYFGAMRDTMKLHNLLLAAPLAGIVGGLLGGLFTRAVLAFGQSAAPAIAAMRARPIAFAAGCGLVVAVLGVVTGGATWGTGYETTRHLVEGHGGLAWFAPAKLVAALATTLSGAPGGIFAPSLAVGAGVGEVLTEFFPQSPTGALVLLGMVGYFTGVVRAPFTAIIIVSETTASRGMIMPFFLTALIADAVSGLVCRERLYHGLSRAFLATAPVADEESERRTG